MIQVQGCKEQEAIKFYHDEAGIVVHQVKPLFSDIGNPYLSAGVPAAPLHIQTPADTAGKAEDSQCTWASALPPWETKMEFGASSFSLAQLCSLWPYGE